MTHAAAQPPVLRVGTRGSLLARTQAGTVRDGLAQAGRPAELCIVTTKGDVNMGPIERIGVGVFTQALRDVLHRGECDVAVHSFKDLPSAPDPRFHLVVPAAAQPYDVLIARDGLTLAELPSGATVGTSAPRRVAQIRSMRPDLTIRPLRGNIDTRMGKVESGELDAVILAAAGLARVGRLAAASEILEPDTLLPAPAQGALAVECRADDAPTVAALDRLSHPASTVRAAAERQILATLRAGCTAPVAAHAWAADGTLTLRAGVFAVDGTRRVVEQRQAAVPQDLSEGVAPARALGREVAEELIRRGALGLIETLPPREEG